MTCSQWMEGSGRRGADMVYCVKGDRQGKIGSFLYSSLSASSAATIPRRYGR